MTWIIAALIAPIPIFHLWLHAMLPTWRRQPFLVYLWGLALWTGSVKLFPLIDEISFPAFEPTLLAQRIGIALIAIGAAAALWSLMTLGPARFFVWAALRPLAGPAERVLHGPFRFLPHPAYTGYLAVALGNLLHSGALYTAGVLAFLLITTPIMIWFEEHEMRERLK